MATPRRRVNLYDVLVHWLETWEPDCAFSGKTRKDYAEWRRKFSRHYRRALGPWPEETPLRLSVVRSTDKGDHLRKKILFDSSPGVTVPAYLLIPKGLRRGERRPGLVAAHGHGGGKDDVVGVSRETRDKEKVAWVEQLNYEYGLHAVQRGYVVIAPDWCPFGERRPPKAWSREPERDPCNVTDMAWLYFGRPLLTQSIWDGMRAVDVLAAHPNVDPRRIGVIGLSQGGTMATHLLINDRRVRAGVISGYCNTLRGNVLRIRNSMRTCGAQHVPGLLLHGDVPDMQGLIAPKPTLFEMGRRETCFYFPDMNRAYQHVAGIYKAAGCADRIGRDVHPHDHRWSGVKAWDWLARWLG